MPVIIDKKFKLPAAFNDLMTRGVLIGIPGDSAREPEPGQSEPPNNAVIGYRLETGDPETNLPARPFLVPGVESVLGAATVRLRKAVGTALTGDRAAVDRALNAIGLLAVAAVQQKIKDGPFAPLSERTLKARKARGRTGKKPLLDTGKLRDSVNYIITEKGPE